MRKYEVTVRLRVSGEVLVSASCYFETPEDAQRFVNVMNLAHWPRTTDIGVSECPQEVVAAESKG